MHKSKRRKNPTPPKLRFVSPPRLRGGVGGGVLRTFARGLVEAWVETHRKILELTTGWLIGEKDASDDRLAKVTEELGKQSLARQEIEIKLGRQIIRAYELPTKIARTDTTSFSVNHENQRDTEENLLRHGYSKDKRPDLLQYRQLLATLDPMGMPPEFLPDSTVFITPINQLQKQILFAMKMPESLYELQLRLCKT